MQNMLLFYSILFLLLWQSKSVHLIGCEDFQSVTNEENKDVIHFRGKCNETTKFSFNVKNSTIISGENLNKCLCGENLKLTVLIIENGNFDELDFIKGLNYLKLIFINNDHIKNIESLRDASNSLKYIDLQRNEIASLAANTFASAIAAGTHGSLLESLNLQYNQISSIDEQAFANLNMLMTLNMNNNKITNLRDSKTFEDLINLRILNLNTNEISGIINPNIFENLNKLVTLNLGNNKLDEFNVTIPNSLKDLRLHDNFLKLFYGLKFIEPQQKSSLLTCILSVNEITNIYPKAFSGLTALKELYLFSNKLTELDPQIFDDLNSLTILYLHNNKLNSLPSGIFQKLIHLQELRIDNNEIKSIDGSIFGDQKFNEMRNFLISNNQLTAIDSELFKNIGKLSTLYLANNNINTFDAKILSIPELEHLFIGGNNVTDFVQQLPRPVKLYIE